jgi:hypothetical protein
MIGGFVMPTVIPAGMLAMMMAVAVGPILDFLNFIIRILKYDKPSASAEMFRY